MATINEIKEAIEKLLKSNEERYLKELFDDIEMKPTLDSQGRLHAPIDNYLWKDGNIYSGGQYLPDPYAMKFDLGEYSKNTLTYKIKVTEEIVPQLKEFLEGSAGKSWEEDSIRVCYFYANVTKSQYNLLEKIIPQVSGKKIVKVSEFGNPDNLKTWKFSVKRAWNKYCSLNAAVDWEFFYPGVDLGFEKNVPVSSFDKCEVRYEYIKPEILSQ